MTCSVCIALVASVATFHEWPQVVILFVIIIRTEMKPGKYQIHCRCVFSSR